MSKRANVKNEQKLKTYLASQNANTKSNSTENKDNSASSQAAK